MNRSCWQAEVLVSSIVGALLCVQPIAAQVVPDTTLPAGERSQVTGDINTQINGGMRLGGNLFHSFQLFSVPTGGSAFFNNAAGVQNIFSRVTGESVSNIDGLIRSNGRANLFLLNPNGILFGPNASLNIGGSFVGTTADAIGFPNGEVFSSDVTRPLPSQLLNVNANALFFNQLAARSIVNRSAANNIGLNVSPRQNLLLIGGTVQLDGGQLNSPGSYVELAGIGGVGRASLVATGEDWQLNIPHRVTRADVSLSNSSNINVTGSTGSIRILAQDIDISSSNLQIGIPNDSKLSDAQTGHMELNATNSITMSDLSTLSNTLSGEGTIGDIVLTANSRISLDYSLVESPLAQTGVGNAGGINITTESLSLTNSGQLVSFTSGRGNAGSITINARGIVLIDGYRGDFSSGIYNFVDSTGIGNGGEINITTGAFSLINSALLISYTGGQGDAGNTTIAADSFSVANGGQLNALTFEQGRAGNVNIMVRNVASFDGVDIFGTPSSILTGVVEGALGDAGDLSITAGSLFLTNGATLSASTLGQGDAGNINLTVRDAILLEGSTRGGTGIFTIVGETGVGNGGNINLRAGSLSIISDGALAADTNGQGQGGNINLDVEGTLLLNGGSRAAPTGEASRITLGVQPGGRASGGDLDINAGSLILTNGGLIKLSTQGQGDAGNVNTRADVVDISGSVLSSGLPSGLFTSSDTAGNAGDINLNTQSFRIADGAVLSARSRGDGQGGNITVNAVRQFEARNGGQLTTTTFGQGQAGNITVNADERIVIAGSDPNYDARLARFPNPIDPLVANAISETGPASGLFANTEPNSAGRGGNIQITTGQLTVQEGARMITSTSGSGRAGNIAVNAADIQLSGATSGLFAQTTTAADAGNLTIQPQGDVQSVQVNLQDGAQISASTFSSGRGGILLITAPESITLTGNGSVIAAGTDGSGTGGNLNFRTGTLNIQNQAEVTVSSSSTGSAGSLFVEADRIFLNNGGRIRADTSGGGGNISLRSPLILLRNGSNITTNATGANIPGGNIDIDTQFLVAVPNEDSNISANSQDFRGGNVNIDAIALYGIQPSMTSTPLSDITATGATSALPGTIDVTTATIDPTAGLVALPTDLVDASQLVAQGCPANEGNSFVVTGRGGLPPTPEQQLDDNVRWGDRRRLVVPREGDAGMGEHGEGEMQGQEESVTNSLRISTSLPRRVSNTPMLEATGWQTTPTGEVVLIADTSNPIVQNSLAQAIACNGRR
jgi:filamentous hemagglutinin family protein